MNYSQILKDLLDAGVQVKTVPGAGLGGFFKGAGPAAGKIGFSHSAVYAEGEGGDSIRDGQPVTILLQAAGRSMFFPTKAAAAVLEKHGVDIADIK